VDEDVREVRRPFGDEQMAFGKRVVDLRQDGLLLGVEQDRPPRRASLEVSQHPAVRRIDVDTLHTHIGEDLLRRTPGERRFEPARQPARIVLERINHAAAVMPQAQQADVARRVLARSEGRPRRTGDSPVAAAAVEVESGSDLAACVDKPVAPAVFRRRP
jgi:hypothetical protein